MSEAPLSFVKDHYEDHYLHLKRSCRFYERYVYITFFFMTAIFITLIIFAIMYIIKNSPLTITGFTAIPNIISGLIGGGGIGGFGGLLYRLHADAKNRLKQTNQELSSYTTFIGAITVSESLINNLRDKIRKDDELLKLRDYVQAGPPREDVSLQTSSPKKGAGKIISIR